jgi:hypothetical protein
MYKNKTINRFLFLFAFLPITFLGQKQGNVWYFGINAGLDFNSVPPTALLNGQTYPYPFGWNEGCSSISDSSGALLFYTNGMKIWNNQQQVMPNGDSLMGNASSTQSSIIVPQPGSNQYFYVFTTDALEHNYQNGLRYSVTDICLDGGMGDVITNQKNIKLLDTVAERLVCARHANGTDYWIITHKLNTDAFYAFQLSSSGISDTVISHTGTADIIGWGQTAISNNSQKISLTAPSLVNGFVLLFDFDPASGIVSNEQTLSSPSRIYGLSFSPDGSKLYCSATGIGEVYQYNLNAGNLAAVIASKTFLVQGNPDGYRQQKLGPDGKIYLSRSGKTYLCRIGFPDSLAPACSYVDSAIYLGGKYTSFGLPNFIAGYDYYNTSLNCEVGVEENKYSSNLTIYPNPFSAQTTLRPGRILKNASLTVFNSSGQAVKQIDNLSGEAVPFHRDNLPCGLYFIRVAQDSKALSTKKLIIIDN